MIHIMHIVPKEKGNMCCLAKAMEASHKSNDVTAIPLPPPNALLSHCLIHLHAHQFSRVVI